MRNDRSALSPKQTALWMTAAVTIAAGCSVIVPSELPAFQCTVDDPTSCPTGQYCDPGSLVCVAEGSVPDADEDVSQMDVDASETDSAVRADLGGGCFVDGDCKDSLICGSSRLLTTAIVPSNAQPICTTPCCTTADCPSGFVCFSGATGGNYCVPAERASRTPSESGGKNAGQTCATATECRSGLCAGRCADAPGIMCTSSSDCPSGSCSGPRRCADTCCKSSECATGSTCRILEVGKQDIWSCSASTTGATKEVGATCDATTECKNDNCVGFAPDRVCSPACCKSSDCTAMGLDGYVCAYGRVGNGRLKWCVAPAQGATAPIGASCNGDDFKCTSQYCDFELGKCMNVCCADEDCAKDEVCRPSSVGDALLRCEKRP